MNIETANYTERVWTVPSNATTIVDEELDTITLTWFPENDPVADRIGGY